MSDEPKSDSVWLRSMGAFRPMACASDEVLVMGSCRSGYYPIMWVRRNTLNDEWWVMGIRVEHVTRMDCERVLRWVGDVK